MCFRYNTIEDRWERFLRRLGVWVAVELPAAPDDLYQGNPGSFVRRTREGRRELVAGHWGLKPNWPAMPPGWTKGYYNARLEGAEEPRPGRPPGLEHMPAFAEPFRWRRAVVPMVSYYEGADQPAAQAAGTYLEISSLDGAPLLIAALWQPPNALSPLPTYTLVTTASSGELARVHSRRLARLDGDTLDAWLDPDAPIDALRALLQPLPEEPLRIRPAEPPRRAQPRTPSLFD